jgi:hypothetical protein
LVENSIVDNLYSKPGSHNVSKARHFIVEIKSYVVC